NLGPSDPRYPLDRVPRCGADIGEQRFDADGVRPDEVPSDRRIRLAVLRFDQRLENPLEQWNVAIDPHLQEQVSDLVAHAEQTQWLLRVNERDQARLTQRVDGYDLPSRPLR